MPLDTKRCLTLSSKSTKFFLIYVKIKIFLKISYQNPLIPYHRLVFRNMVYCTSSVESNTLYEEDLEYFMGCINTQPRPVKIATLNPIYHVGSVSRFLNVIVLLERSICSLF